MLSEKVNIICLLILGLFLTASNAGAQTLASAKILSSDGPVEIQRRSQGQAALMKIEYRVNDELLAGDVIKTRKGGRLVLGLADGSQAIISENTTVEITDLTQSPRTIFNLLRGKTRVKIEKVGGRPNPYRVNTPTAVIAVRGTLFDVIVTEKETQVFVHEGEVSVSNSARMGGPVILSPGERTRVQLTQPPESPRTFHPGLNDDTFKPHTHERGPNGETSDGRGDDHSGPGRGGDKPGRSDQREGPGRDAPSSPVPPPSGQRDGGGGGRPPEQFEEFFPGND